MSEREVLYVTGIFDSPDRSTWPAFGRYVDAIEASRIDTVILSTFHVGFDGNLFGAAPLVTGGVFNAEGKIDPRLPSFCEELAAAGKTLLYSIGSPAGTSADLAALAPILGDRGSAASVNLKRNLQVLFFDLAISGIDFDFQPASYGRREQETVTKFTLLCNSLGLNVTYSPHAEASWWIAAQRAAYDAGGCVAWWNRPPSFDGRGWGKIDFCHSSYKD